MPVLRKFGFLAAVGLLAALPAVSQLGGMRPPEFRGIFNAVVGSGAAYEMDGKTGKNNLEITVVGKEDVNGKSGVWVELAVNQPQGGQMYAKNLMVVDGNTATSTRVIVQLAGQPPMDVSSMLAGQQLPPASADVRNSAEKVGTEDVTTPAGTFSCDHYKAKDGSWEVWLSSKVIPWGLVKSTNNADLTMVLTKVIAGATDHITGTPVPMNPGAFGRPGGAPGQGRAPQQ
jgi:hypothetical protein